MKATLTLPENYHEYAFWRVTTHKLMLWLNLASVGVLAVGLIIFGMWWGVIQRLREAESEITFSLTFNLILLGSLLVLTPLHEWCHGLAIQYYGLEPRYGLKLRKGVAFATPRSGYLERNQYIVVLLAPLGIISFLAILLIPFVPPNLGLIVALNGAINMASAVGDLWMSWIAWRQPMPTLVSDEEDGMRFFRPHP